jgi:hypothetical protein
MAGSPFDIFRRNQRQMMVVITGLAMFSFLFLDNITRQSGALPLSLGVILIAAICAGGLWIVGAPRGKGTEFALWGALIGAVAGYVGFRNQQTGDVIHTAIGGFSQNDFQMMAQRRAQANRFVAAATNGQGGFGGTDERSLVMRALMLSEAKQRGIAVSDDGVSEFIQDITDKKLPLPKYKEILKDLGQSEGELYDVLREELQAKLAIEMEYPPRQRFGRGSIQTPLTYWKQFQMLQVREALDAAEIPVAAFVAQVPEPTDDELVKFYEAFKGQLPTQDGKPGFMRDRTVQLAYVAAEFEEFEQLAAKSEPTDDEVAAYYETNKARYIVQELPDSPANDPNQPLMPEFVEDAEPTSALEPANSPTAAPANQPPAPELPESNGNDGGCGGQEPAVEKPANAPAEPSKTLELPPPATKAPVGELTLPPPAGGANSAPLPPAPPKYRELDDALKLEIRETMLRQSAFAMMRESAERALEEMTKLADEYLAEVDDAARKKLEAKLSERLKTYAATQHLKYVETPPMTQDELSSSASEPIGMAMEPGANPFTGGGTVTDDAFANDALYYPRRADAMLRDKSYAYWKIADRPQHVPEFKDVKTQVAEAWKFDRARPLADKRAKELSELVTKSGKRMSEALAGQTVTGAPESPAVTVRETPRFSWWNVPRNVPFQFNQGFSMPQISTIEGIKQAGNDFMRIVFDELGPNQVGVAPNQPRQEFYVVQVRQRDATPTESGDNLGLRALQQQFLLEGRSGFLSAPYMLFAQIPQSEIERGWLDGFWKRYGVDWSEADAQQANRTAGR